MPPAGTQPPLDIPEDWAAAVRQVLEGRWRRVAVLGPGDAGKSSLCRVLLAAAAAAGRPAALLDADPAQKLLGPPATVTLGRMAPDGRLTLEGMTFLGTLDPLRGWARLLGGIARLAEEAGPGLVLANTGGLLAGAGQRLKAAKLRALRAELIIAIGADPGLEAVLAAHAALPVLRLAPSPLARRKSAGERRAIRQAAFRHHFAGAIPWSFAPGALRVEEAPGLAGMRPERLLLGLADAAGRDLCLGILARSGASGDPAVIAPSGPAAVAVLRCGLLTIDAEFQARPAPGR